ncbi:MAG TPA: TetR/AcrR family transcriptional regulator [Solirubrobacterales bacterium]|nr:TetR/AcrR family transcriptional regulator [Solirubrobacterales bacterium]
MIHPQASEATRVVQVHRRQQIVVGLIDAVERCGPSSLTVSDVVEAAGVSPRDFHEHFDDLDECFDFACEAALDILLDPLAAAFSVPRPPLERLEAAIAALLGALATQPRLAELCLIHSSVRQRDRRTYRRAVDSLAELLRQVRPPTVSPRSPSSPAGEELLAGGALALIAARLAAGQREDLQELAPQLVELVAPPLALEPAHWLPSALR